MPIPTPAAACRAVSRAILLGLALVAAVPATADDRAADATQAQASSRSPAPIRR